MQTVEITPTPQTYVIGQPAQVLTPMANINVATLPSYAQMPYITQQLGNQINIADPSTISVMAFLFTDIVGSSRLTAKYGIYMQQALDAHERQVNRILRETQMDPLFRGDHMLVKWIGDSALIAFTTLSAATYFAMRLQRELLTPATAIYIGPGTTETKTTTYITPGFTETQVQPVIEKPDKLILRVGIAYGPSFKRYMVIQNNITVADFFGNTLNTASRMESKVSVPGGIAIGLTSDVEQKGIAELESFQKLDRVKPLLIPADKYSADSDDGERPPLTATWKWDVERYVAPGTVCLTSGPTSKLSQTDPDFKVDTCKDSGDLKGVSEVLVIEYIPLVSPL